MIITERPNSILDTDKIAVTVSQAVTLTGKTAILKNLGPGTLYISNASPATADDFPLVSGDTFFPVTGVLYAVSESTSDLRVLIVKGGE